MKRLVRRRLASVAWLFFVTPLHAYEISNGFPRFQYLLLACIVQIEFVPQALFHRPDDRIFEQLRVTTIQTSEQINLANFVEMILQITQIVAIDQCQMKHLDKTKSFCSQTNSQRLFLGRDHVIHRKSVPGHQCRCHLLEQLLAYFQTELIQVGKIRRPSHLQQALRVRIGQKLQVVRQDGVHNDIGFDRHYRASVARLPIAHFYEQRLLHFSNARDDALAAKFVTFDSCRSIHPQVSSVQTGDGDSGITAKSNPLSHAAAHALHPRISTHREPQRKSTTRKHVTRLASSCGINKHLRLENLPKPEKAALTILYTPS
ncbi:hypothetical protein T07_3592 [Trichinella nelsoni]|uniref:Secreted protein n=1 Tax=Trichinella nelsoni TaxID=6336 RepID=A0A0V0S2Y5_9BILA|nr:hypothetical protein T07_3592 [Trichinella nelsoni]